MPMGLTAVQFFAVGAPLRAFPPPGILSRSSRSWGLLSPPSGLPQMSPPPETSSDHPGGARRHRPGPLLPCPPQQLLRPGLLALAVLRPETARVAEVSLSLSFLIWTLRATSPPPRAGVRTAGSSAGNVPPRCQHGPGWGFGHKWSLLPCRPGSSGSGGPRGSCRCTCTWRGRSPGAGTRVCRPLLRALPHPGVLEGKELLLRQQPGGPWPRSPAWDSSPRTSEVCLKGAPSQLPLPRLLGAEADL